jgi:hypothetical protein
MVMRTHLAVKPCDRRRSPSSDIQLAACVDDVVGRPVRPPPRRAGRSGQDLDDGRTDAREEARRSEAALLVKAMIVAPCVRMRCVKCDLVLGIIAPTGERAITAAFNRSRNGGYGGWRQVVESIGDGFIVDDPQEHADAWELPAILTAWCPRCEQLRSMSCHEAIAATLRTRASGEGEDLRAFQ